MSEKKGKYTYKSLRCLLLGQCPKFGDAVEEFNNSCSRQPVDTTGIKERIKDEDDLLNTRTNIFLVLNGLVAIAVGNFQTLHLGHLIVPVVALIIDLLWFYCVRQSLKIIAGLTVALRTIDKEEPIESLVQELLGRSHWARPTTVLTVYLPGLVILSWIVVAIIIVCAS